MVNITGLSFLPCDALPLQLRFIDNTDPAGIDRQLDQVGAELSSTLVIVISKVCALPLRHPSSQPSLSATSLALRTVNGSCSASHYGMAHCTLCTVLEQWHCTVVRQWHCTLVLRDVRRPSVCPEHASPFSRDSGFLTMSLSNGSIHHVEGVLLAYDAAVYPSLCVCVCVCVCV